jgi:hypothetical protein
MQRPMEQNRRSRYEFVQIHSPDCSQRSLKHHGEKTTSSTNVSVKTGCPCHSSCTSINSKWLKDLNITPKTLKLVQERAGNTLEHIGINNNFLNRTPMIWQLRERTDKWDYMKLKSFCTKKKRSLD